MNTHLEKYLEIYQKFPFGGYFSKEQRKIRHKMILDWKNSNLQELPSLDELTDFVKQYKDIIQVNSRFFEKFQSVWQSDLENGYQFAEFLLEMDLAELMWNFDISSIYFADQVLKHNSNHSKALKLKLKLKTLVRYHDFCLHEFPLGVLVKNSLDEELQSVEEMEAIAAKLKFKNENFDVLLSNCKTYYPLWFEYLKVKEKDGFENFLHSKGIDTERTTLPYISL